MAVFCTLSWLRRARRFVSVFIVAWLALALPATTRLFPGPVSAAAGPHVASLARLPLAFVPNAGQTDRTVHFQAQSAGGALFFTSNEVVLSLPILDQSLLLADEGSDHSLFAMGHSSIVRLRFEGADPSPAVAATGKLDGVVNYFIGDDPGRWRTGLPTFREIVYREVYPGIDLRYNGLTEESDRSFLLKGAYHVAPGADPGLIRWRYVGAENVRMDKASGDLFITPSSAAQSTVGQTLVERAPVAWQVVEGERVPVNAGYSLAADGSIGFDLDGYDPAYPLVVDPTLTYSTYLGGSNRDIARAVAVDAGGNVYVTGQTASTDFPRQNPAQPDFGGGGFGDTFVVKLDPSGSALVYATYLGGSNDDTGHAIAVDSYGAAYIAGDTLSANFPTEKAVQPVSGGGGPFEGDAFVVKLSPTGSTLVYSTYLGGQGDEIGYGIALDGGGNAYVTGYTSSTNFPTRRAPQPNPSFPQGLNILGDAFVTQIISASGVYTWGYSTFLGGQDWDEGHSIAVDAAGNAYVTGNTRSADFPTERPAQPIFGGGSGFDRGDAFVTQVISASGVYTWGYSTFLGGGGGDTGAAIAVDASDNAYVTGETASTNFPTAHPFQNARAGAQDAFVTKIISASGVYTWGYSTYLGGGGSDSGRGIALDNNREAYLGGFTRSDDFPVTPGAYDELCGINGLCDGNNDDAWFAKLGASGSSLTYATYLGGSRADQGYGVAVDARGNAYLVGETNSVDFPVSIGAYDSSCGTDGVCNGAFAPDAFVLKIAMAPDLFVYLPIVLKGPEETPPPGCAPSLVANITVGDSPQGLAIDEGRGRVYVANYVSGSISVIDADSHAVVGTVPGIPSANDVAYDPTHDLIWVTNHLADQVTPVDAEQLIPLASVTVGDGPWGIAYDVVHDSIYVVNNLDDSVTVVDADSRVVVNTLTDSFTQPFQAAAAWITGKVYITNFGGNSVTVIDGTSLSTVDLEDIGQPYGVAVDETRGLAYIATVDGHRVVAIGSDPAGTPTRVLNWAAIYRGHDPTRPVPLRAIAVNPDIGPVGDGGHLWLTTTVADGGEDNLALLMSKGLAGYFAWPVPYELATSRSGDVVVDRSRDQVYFSGGTAGAVVTVLGDSPEACVIPFGVEDGFGLETLFVP